QLSSWSLYSVIPKTGGLLLGSASVRGLLAADGLATWIPALAYLGALYFIIVRRRVPQWCWGPLALASMQLLVPISYVYTSAWALPAAVWYVQGRLIPLPDRSSIDDAVGHVILRLLLLLALTATLVPSVFTIAGSGGFDISTTALLSPLLLFVTLGVAFVSSI